MGPPEYEITLNPLRCPCGSGKPVKVCCLQSDGTLHKAKTWIAPGPPTGIAHPGCYVAPLLDCQGSITTEHFLTESVLRYHSNDNPLEVSGLHWLHGAAKSFTGTSSLGSNVLCVRHNRALSRLDDEGLRFFVALDQMNKILGDGTGTDAFTLFNGHDIERWMLKTLCGLAVSGNATWKGKQLRDWRPPETWLHILFGGEQFPAGWGLYYEVDRGGTTDPGIRLAAFLANEDAVLGLHLWMLSFHFVLVMAEPPQDRSGTILAHSTYRPAELVYVDQARTHILKFSWDQTGEEKGVRLQLSRLQPK